MSATKTTMTLNITQDGEIDYLGEPFLFGAFFPKQQFVRKPVEVEAQKIPYPFTFDTGSGVVPFAKGDWLVKHADGSLSGVSDADLQADYNQKQ
jgi:hypothetical protein